MAVCNPKTYRDRGQTLASGAILTEKQAEELRAGEVFTVLDSEGRPHSRVLMDSFDQLRETLDVDPTRAILGGTPLYRPFLELMP